MQSNFFVRVKRRREDDPAESLCLVEGEVGAKRRIVGLGAGARVASSGRSLLLSRVRTLECGDDAVLQEAHASLYGSQPQPQPQSQSQSQSRVAGSQQSKSEWQSQVW